MLETIQSVVQESPMDRGALWATDRAVAENQTGLSSELRIF